MSSYELIDSGDFARLERFADIVLNRPAPQAHWQRRLDPSIWQNADFTYIRNESNPKLSQWIKSSQAPESWQININQIIAELSLSPNGQIGIFPEQKPNWEWLDQIIKQTNRPLRILNGFAHTGLATVFAAKAASSIQVCHVDGAASAIKRAKFNATLNQTPSTAIRWIEDDINTFLQREINRGHRYDCIILDPPAFGRGKGFTWKFEKDFPVLLDCVEKLIAENPLFVIISCHVQNLTSEELLLQCQSIPSLKSTSANAFSLTIPSTKGNSLPSGVCVRFKFT